MNSLPPQRIDDLSAPARWETYNKLALICLARREGNDEEEDLYKKAGFPSAEAMRISLKNWGLSALLPCAETESPRNPAKGEDRKKSDRPFQTRSLGPAEELPPAGGLAELIRERLEALMRDVEILEHRTETLRGGRYFVGTDEYTDSVYLPRSFYSDEEWQELCEQHNLDPDDEGFVHRGGSTIVPTGCAQSPAEPLPTLVMTYLLAGGEPEPLLKALRRPAPSSGDTEILGELRKLLEGTKSADGKDGARALARQAATLLYGDKAGRGRPSKLTPREHNLACTITEYAESGWSDEEIALDLDLSKDDLKKLKELHLNWS